MTPVSPSGRSVGLAVLFALAGWTVGAQGLELPDRPTARINDYASALPAEARQRLEDELQGYARGQSYQVAVALFRSLDGQNLEDASIRLAEKWRIGSQKDDGVLITVFLAEHQIRIEVGYGLEDRLPDARASRIIREVITPLFRKGDLEGGLRAGLAAIDTAVTGRAHPGEKAALPRERPVIKAPGAVIGGVLLLMLFVFVIVAIAAARQRRSMRHGRGGWSAGSAGWIGTAGWLGSGMSSWSSSDRSDRGGFFGGGGGGFSGGGGSFGGGGASGSW